MFYNIEARLSLIRLYSSFDSLKRNRYHLVNLRTSCSFLSEGKFQNFLLKCDKKIGHSIEKIRVLNISFKLVSDKYF